VKQPSDHSVFAHNAEVAWRVLDGRLVAVTPGDSTLHRFNRSATFLWEQLKERAKSASQLHGALVQAFQTDPKTAKADLNRFLSLALKKKLLVRLE
jgi:hypothetical protein